MQTRTVFCAILLCSIVLAFSAFNTTIVPNNQTINTNKEELHTFNSTFFVDAIGGGYRDRPFTYSGVYVATLDQIDLFIVDPNQIIIRKVGVNASILPEDLCPYPWTDFKWQPYGNWCGIENVSIRCDIIIYAQIRHLTAQSVNRVPFKVYIDGQLYAEATDGFFDAEIKPFIGHIDYWGLVRNETTNQYYAKHFDYDITCVGDGALEFATMTGTPITINFTMTGIATYAWIANFKAD